MDNLRDHLLERNVHVTKPQVFRGYQLIGCGCEEPQSTKVLEVQKTTQTDDILRGLDDVLDRAGWWGNEAAALCLRWLRSVCCHLAASREVAPL